MKYDDASWHYGGDFPQDLPEVAGSTHIGMFLAWMLLNDFASADLVEDAEGDIDAIRERTITGATFLIEVLDEKLTDEDFSDDGNAFAVAYYKGLDDDSCYIDDYLDAFNLASESIYGVEDTWQNYDKLALLMNARLVAWEQAGKPKYIVQE
jgi:hypothetical protein